MRRILLILTVAALMAAFLTFSSSGVAFAQDEPAVVADQGGSNNKDACKNGGYKTYGYDNQGQCVKAANEAARAGESFPPEFVATKDLPKSGGPEAVSLLLPASAVMLVGSGLLGYAVLRRR